MSNKIIKNTLYMQIAHFMQIGIQALYFILIARGLNPSGYGAYASVLAFASFFSPFASWGSGRLMIMHVAREPDEFSRYWGAAIVTTVFASFVFLLAVGFLKIWLLPSTISFGLVLAIALADLFFGRFVDLNAQAFQAVQQLSYTGLIQVVLSICRAASACLFWVLPMESSAFNWACLYLGATALSAVISFIMVYIRIGAPRLNLSFLSELREGFYFAMAATSSLISNDLDKVMLVKMSGQLAVGVYASAYKIIFMAFSPVVSLLYSTYAQFFSIGKQGLQATTDFARRLLIPAGLYSGAVALVLFLGAPLVPLVLGNGYAESVIVLRWLAILPLVKTFQNFGGDALTGAGYQRDRTILQLLTALLNFLANLWFIPRYSWLGAAWTTLACDGFLAVSVWLLLAVRLKDQEALMGVLDVD